MLLKLTPWLALINSIILVTAQTLQKGSASAGTIGQPSIQSQNMPKNNPLSSQNGSPSLGPEAQAFLSQIQMKNNPASGSTGDLIDYNAEIEKIAGGKKEETEGTAKKQKAAKPQETDESAAEAES